MPLALCLAWTCNIGKVFETSETRAKAGSLLLRRNTSDLNQINEKGNCPETEEKKLYTPLRFYGGLFLSDYGVSFQCFLIPGNDGILR